MRLLAVPIFALAVAGATLAGSGLAVVPHVDPPGTPRFHDHVLAAYRYPLFLIRRAEETVGGPGFKLAPPPFELAALVMALLVLNSPRLPRPSRVALARVAAPRIVAAQWRGAPVHAPPRV